MFKAAHNGLGTGRTGSEGSNSTDSSGIWPSDVLAVLLGLPRYGGRGDGPATDALKKRLADLLARKNNGTFPELHVMNFITGQEVVAAHGSRDIPVWGALW